MTDPTSPRVLTPAVVAAVASPKWVYGWKSVTGTAIAVFGYLAQPQVLAVLPGKAAAVVQAVGIVLAAFGFRHAIAKNGAGL